MRNFLEQYITRKIGAEIKCCLTFLLILCFYCVYRWVNGKERAEGYERSLPINIGHNVWIGGNVSILGGVTIGNESIIAAGSVVTKDIPSGVIAAGNPAKVLRKITDNDKIQNYT